MGTFLGGVDESATGSLNLFCGQSPAVSAIRPSDACVGGDHQCVGFGFGPGFDHGLLDLVDSVPDGSLLWDELHHDTIRAFVERDERATGDRYAHGRNGLPNLAGYCCASRTDIIHVLGAVQTIAARIEEENGVGE